MQLGEQPDEGLRLARVVAAPLPCPSLDEGEERDRMAGTEPEHRLAAAGCDRRDDEREPGLTQRYRGVEGVAEAVEGRLPRVAEPGLGVEVVDGDKPRRPSRLCTIQW